MPGARIKKVPAIDTLDLFHGRLLPVRENGLNSSHSHLIDLIPLSLDHFLLPVRENGLRIKELDQLDANERN